MACIFHTCAQIGCDLFQCFTPASEGSANDNVSRDAILLFKNLINAAAQAPGGMEGGLQQ